GTEANMATSYMSIPPPLGLLPQRYPPPLPPKPGKDNLRLQKFLKRSAKKKPSVQAAPAAAVYRSSLSPVNEASPDLEHSDLSTPPRTPETPLRGTSHPPPRFTVRPLYRHVASPYPQRAGWGQPASFFPDSPTTPPILFPQHAAPFATAPLPLAVPGPALLSKAGGTGVPFKLEITTPAIQVTLLAASSVQSQPAVILGALRTPSPVPVRYSGPSPVSVPYSGLSPVPASYSGSQAMTKPLTVLTSFAKPKSPRPNFKATESWKSPKPMFEVPQIRMYTANTSFYESSKTPPVYDTAELTSIGITLQRNKPDSQEATDSSQAAQVLLKALGKPKGMKSKLSGWCRLKKHMVVEQEEPTFPTGKDEKKEEGGGQVVDEGKPSEGKPDGDSNTTSKDAPKGAKMWDAVLFQMFSTKENIMHQIELNKSEEEKNKDGTKDESMEIPAFAHRLPILLFSPKFDAKKLREAASRPLTKISTVFEMGLIGRKNKEEEPKDFNRTARGYHRFFKNYANSVR
ncbi:hypothetical protein CRUP_022650, partial [Coryphaenoides rupestris]